MSPTGPAPGRVVVVGSANLDVIASLPAIPAPGETVLATGRDQRAGGKGLNQAVAAARAGVPTAFVAAVGDDDASGVLLGTAAEAGVDTTHVRRVDGPSGSAWIMVRTDGENAIVVDPAANARLLDLTGPELDAVRGAAVLVCQLEVPLVTVVAAARAAREAGAEVVLNAAPAQALPQALLELVDVLVVNEHEARQVGEDAVARVPAVVTTLGADGARVRDAAGTRHVPGTPAHVVDTTGAGDTATGYLAAGLAAGLSLTDATARAVVAGALAVETAGATSSIPTAAAVDARATATQERAAR